MNFSPRCLCWQCGGFSGDCIWVQAIEHEPYRWWCLPCVDTKRSAVTGPDPVCVVLVERAVEVVQRLRAGHRSSAVGASGVSGSDF